MHFLENHVRMSATKYVYHTQTFVFMHAQNFGDYKDERTCFECPSFSSNTFQQSHTSTRVAQAHRCKPHTISPQKTLLSGSVTAYGKTVSVLIDKCFSSRGLFCACSGVVHTLHSATSNATPAWWLASSFTTFKNEHSPCYVFSLPWCLFAQSPFPDFHILQLPSPTSLLTISLIY